MITLERKHANPAVSKLVRLQLEGNKTNHFTLKDDWDIYGDRGIDSYEDTFVPVLGDETIVNFVGNKKSPVVLDVMGPASVVADLFIKIPDKLTKLGFAISLLDRKPEDEKRDEEELGVKQFSGNVLFGFAGILKKIEDELGGRRIDLIMERAVGGLGVFPKNEDLYLMVLNKVWSLLSEDNGMLLFQVPSYLDLKQKSVRIEEWVNLLKENNLNVAYYNNKHSDDHAGWNRWIDRGVLKIVKTPDSPKKLPFLK